MPELHDSFQRTARITGVGAYLPDRILTNQDLERMVDTTDEWIITRTGIRERHVVAEDEALSDLVVRAGRAALADADPEGWYDETGYLDPGDYEYAPPVVNSFWINNPGDTTTSSGIVTLSDVPLSGSDLMMAFPPKLVTRSLIPNKPAPILSPS